MKIFSSTAKINVIRYCERQAQLAQKALHIIDRDALSLLWQYMALLVKNNGVRVMTHVTSLFR